MGIESFLQSVIDEPIRNGLVTAANLKTMWDAPVELFETQTRVIPGKPPLRYTLLRYIPGLVTYCTIGPDPVWTGYMSGCFLFRFRMAGRLCAAHVGTDDSDKEKNDKVKLVWRNLANSGAVTELVGCNPALEISAMTLTAIQKSGQAAGVTGWWEANGAMRTVVLSGIHGQDTKKKIFAVDASPLRPWDVIRGNPKFL